jgi:hypothetical protein
MTRKMTCVAALTMCLALGNTGAVNMKKREAKDRNKQMAYQNNGAMMGYQQPQNNPQLDVLMDQDMKQGQGLFGNQFGDQGQGQSSLLGKHSFAQKIPEKDNNNYFMNGSIVNSSNDGNKRSKNVWEAAKVSHMYNTIKLGDGTVLSAQLEFGQSLETLLLNGVTFEGKLTWSNGKTYKGQIANTLPFGKGLEVVPNGEGFVMESNGMGRMGLWEQGQEVRR